MWSIPALREFLWYAAATKMRRWRRLHARVQRILSRPEDTTHSDQYAASVYEHFSKWCTGDQVLEIGPGRNLGACARLACDGRRVLAMDIADLRADETPTGVTYLQGAAESIPLADGSVDYAYSNAVLEHVADPDQVAGELWRILAPGGRTVHQIDLRDHHHGDAAPLRFLWFGERAWRWMTPAGVNWMNRYRVSDHRRAFERQGFRVHIEVNQWATPAQMADVRHAAPRWRHLSEEDAATLGCLLVAEKAGTSI